MAKAMRIPLCSRTKIPGYDHLVSDAASRSINLDQRILSSGRKNLFLATTAAAALLFAATADRAGATVWTNFTNSTFITISPGNTVLTFVFDGKSAAFTDNMEFILSSNTQQFVVSNNAQVGTKVSVTGLTPGNVYGLELIDTGSGQHWSSDPTKDGTTVGNVTYTSDLINNNGDSCNHANNSCAQAPHLAFTTNWGNFGLGGSAPGEPGSTYYGWEDLPLAGNVEDATISGGVVTQIDTGSWDSGDYNDLVFQVSQSSGPPNPVPEPPSLTILAAGLLAIGLMRQQRRGMLSCVKI
jgi:hypothetical protein